MRQVFQCYLIFHLVLKVLVTRVLGVGQRHMISILDLFGLPFLTRRTDSCWKPTLQKRPLLIGPQLVSPFTEDLFGPQLIFLFTDEDFVDGRLVL